jgi:hypothetical protein
VENPRWKLAENVRANVPVGDQDVFKWNVDFFREITQKYLRLLNAAGKG